MRCSLKILFLSILIPGTAIAQSPPDTYAAGASLIKNASDQILANSLPNERNGSDNHWDKTFSFYGKIESPHLDDPSKLRIIARWYTHQETKKKIQSFLKRKGYPDYIKIVTGIPVDKEGYFKIENAVGNELAIQFQTKGFHAKEETYFFSNQAREGFTKISEDTPVILRYEKKNRTLVNLGADHRHLIPYPNVQPDSAITREMQSSEYLDQATIQKILGSEAPELYLRIAVGFNRPKILNRLIQSGISPWIVDGAEFSLIQAAVMLHEDTEIIEYLVDLGIPINHLDAGGLTALDYAIIKKKSDIAAYLESRGALRREQRALEKYHGLGINIKVDRDRTPYIESFSSISPACQSGLVFEKEKIIRINGIDTKGRSRHFIAQLFAGPNGSEISLEMMDNQNQQRTVTLKRGYFESSKDHQSTMRLASPIKIEIVIPD
ncbi:MAG: ankyrin repeat domain-containing protein [Opitutales bacterium]